jgi:hypothetical protein
MKIKYLLVYLFITAVTYNSSFAQQNLSELKNIKDSIVTYTNVAFTVPRYGSEFITTQVKYDDYKINVYSIDNNNVLNPVTDNAVYSIDTIISKPKKGEDFERLVKNGHGAVVATLVKLHFINTGKYLVQTQYFGAAEKGVEFHSPKENNYIIEIKYPTASSTKIPDKTYFVGEKSTFSFATDEYNENSKYSWSIFNREDTIKSILSGNGPIVKLDSLFDDENIGKSFVVKGFYDGKTFVYKNPVSKKEKETRWEFAISNDMGMDDWSLWKLESNKDEKVPLLDICNESYWNAHTFTYQHKIRKGTNTILLNPSIKSVRAEFSIPGLITEQPIVKKDGYLSLIKFKFNKDVFEDVGLEGQKEVTLKLSFKTVLGKTIVKNYRAILFKSKE